MVDGIRLLSRRVIWFGLWEAGLDVTSGKKKAADMQQKATTFDPYCKHSALTELT